MKKTLLALAVSALSANAFAANVDYRVATPAVNTIATELALPAAGLVTTVDTLTWDLGFSITANTQRYIKVRLTNGAKFTNAPTLTAGTVPVTGVISQGGAGFDYAILEVSPTANIAPTEPVVVTLANLNLTGKNDVGVSYQLFETAVDAVAGTNPLVNKAAAPYINFANGVAVRVQAPTDAQRIIDVGATPSSSKFVGAPATTTATIGNVAVAVVPGLVTYNTATTAALTDLVAAGTSLVVSGDFSAAVPVAGGAIPPAAVTLNGVNASAVTANSATFTVGTTAIGAIPAVGNPTYHALVYTPNGTTAIVPSVYNALYDVTPATGTSTADVNLGKIGELAKNGASQYVDLALKPGGAFQYFVRISNKTNVAGNVYITVINDNGDRQTVKLGEVAGQSDTLGARSSTTQISIRQIFDAAAAKGLALSGEGKLRLLVDGEFPTNGTTIDANNYGLSVQTYSVAKNGNSLNTF